jgi:sarcosine oxidase subunit alpha
MHVLRAERGFIIVGQETDGTVSPDDLGLAGMISKRKPDFVGKRSLARPDLVARGRKQLVGLLTENPAEILDEGAQVLANPASLPALGHVTSSYWSSNVGSSIALALVSDGRARCGERLCVTTPTGFTKARVTRPAFIDPVEARANA